MNFELKLSEEKVDQAFPVEPLCMAGSATLREALQTLKSQQTGSLLVCDGDRMIGIFTERDALRFMSQGTDLATPLEQVMTRDPVTLSQNDTVGQAIAKMSFGGYRRLPIVDSDGCASGIVKASGILRYLVDHFPDIVYNLPPEPHHSTTEREGA